MTEIYNREYAAFVLAIMMIVGVGSSALAAENEAKSQVAVAQHTGEPADSLTERETSSGEELVKKHKLTLAFGYTHIAEGADDEHSDKGVWVPGLGLDYFYRLKEKWEIGLAADVEFGEYQIIDEDLNRHNAYILIALVGYELAPSWAISGGVGVEIEPHKNLPVLRVATEYEFLLQNDWLVAPGVLVDYKSDFTSLGVFVRGGKRF